MFGSFGLDVMNQMNSFGLVKLTYYGGDDEFQSRTCIVTEE